MQPKTTSVNMSEIVKDNPTLCLSALRVFANCHKCSIFLSAFENHRQDKLKCKPKIKPKIRELLNQKRKLIVEHRIQINKILHEIEVIE